jgi:phosphatidylglycerol:prolipoprotein diacylglycerol transferase
VAYGGMIGGFFASWYGCHKRGIPLLKWADVSAPSVVLGTAITRVGCLLFGCDFGGRTNLPWAIRFPGPNPLAPQGSPAWQHHVHDLGLSQAAAYSYPIHPTQVYESLVGLALFGLMVWLRHHRRFSGQVFLAWVLGYGIMRPLIEIVRDDDQRGNVGALSTSQFIGIVSVVLGIALLIALVRRYRRDPDSLRLWEIPTLAPAGGPPDGPAAERDRPTPKRRKRR